MTEAQAMARIQWDAAKIAGRPAPKRREIYEGAAEFHVQGLPSNCWSVELTFLDAWHYDGKSDVMIRLLWPDAPHEALLRPGNRFAVIENGPIGEGEIIERET